ncbi:MAG: thioredoxin [Alphaproteobacteria bacterium]
MEPLIAGGPGGRGDANLIKDTTTEQFMTDVIDASMDTPVVVDFWAPWCGPCKTLGPQLEAAVKAARGAVRMVKLNIDEHPQIAQQMRIQSIPAVFAFKDGRPVDGFVGALPASQIKQFIDKLVQMGGGAAAAQAEAIERAMEQAKTALDGGDARTAAAIYSQVLNADNSRLPAADGLIRAVLGLGDVAGARQQFDAFPVEMREAKELQSARTALELAEQNADAVAEMPRLQAAVDANANAHEERLALANALFALGQTEPAIDHLLELYRRDRAWNDDAARVQLLKFFEALGHTHPATISGRRRLSSMMFA